MSTNGEYQQDFDDLAPASLKFRYKGKGWLAREASADAAAKFRDFNLNASRYEDNGDGTSRLVGYTNLNDGEALLVSLCVYPVGEDGNPVGSHPGHGDVKGWSSRVVGTLFNWIREHSDLGDDTAESLRRQIASLQKRLDRLERDQAGSLSKNVPAATPASSA